MTRWFTISTVALAFWLMAAVPIAAQVTGGGGPKAPKPAPKSPIVDSRA